MKEKSSLCPAPSLSLGSSAPMAFSALREHRSFEQESADQICTPGSDCGCGEKDGRSEGEPPK